MSPFTFADGTYVPSGNWVCVPQQAIMLDENNYANANVFDGFRFVRNKDQDSPFSDSRFSHPSWSFPFWGSVKQAW